MKRKLLSLLVLLVTAATGAWADTTITWNHAFCSNVSASNGFCSDNSYGGIIVTASGGPYCYFDGGLLRLDQGDKLTFTSTVGNIQKIEVYYTYIDQDIPVSVGPGPLIALECHCSSDSGHSRHLHGYHWIRALISSVVGNVWQPMIVFGSQGKNAVKSNPYDICRD